MEAISGFISVVCQLLMTRRSEAELMDWSGWLIIMKENMVHRNILYISVTLLNEYSDNRANGQSWQWNASVVERKRTTCVLFFFTDAGIGHLRRTSCAWVCEGQPDRCNQELRRFIRRWTRRKIIRSFATSWTMSSGYTAAAEACGAALIQVSTDYVLMNRHTLYGKRRLLVPIQYMVLPNWRGSRRWWSIAVVPWSSVRRGSIPLAEIILWNDASSGTRARDAGSCFRPDRYADIRHRRHRAIGAAISQGNRARHLSLQQRGSLLIGMILRWLSIV